MMKPISVWKQELAGGTHTARLASLYCCSPEQTAAHAAEQKRRKKRNVQRRECKIAHISADHDDASVGKVGKVHNAVDQRIADRHQRVHTAEADAVDQLLEKIFYTHV